VPTLHGKAAIVTGAASGLGLAIATALAAEGASVCIADLNEHDGRAVADEFERRGGRAMFTRVDVADAGSARDMVESAARAFGRLDVLVNNAGLQYIAPIVEFPEERWNYLLGVLLTGTFLCTKYALPHMIKGRWGRIINMASAHGLVASPFKSAYVAAKHGVVGFTKTAAWEVAEHGITVNAICPGYVRTPLVERQIAHLAGVHQIPESEVVSRIMLEAQAVKRLLEPSEIAALALYLCSDAAATMTGAALPIDGGWTAH
jgi:3-hydroxybutyrate dehydrogenase